MKSVASSRPSAEASDHVKEGDVVGVEPLLRCGECGHCISGHYNQCQGRPGGLIGIAVDGGIAPGRLRTGPGGLQSAARHRR